MDTKWDVIIIGAGAAGMACANDLARTSPRLKVLMLEARSRVGGRILTARSTSHFGIELGAEFIHGRPPELLDVLTAEALPFVSVGHRSWTMGSRGLIESTRFDRSVEHLQRDLRKLKTDRTMEAALKSRRPKAATRDLRSFVEGFHAATLSRMGVQGFLDASGGSEDEFAYRMPLGYDRVVAKMAQSLPTVRFETVVKKIDWSKDRVQLVAAGRTGANSCFKCRAVVITVPHGVLKSDLEISPTPANWATKLSAIEMGHVQRITFEFRQRFWERIDPDIGFMYAGNDLLFPTWWSLLPLYTPHLVAWQGGPKAELMSGWSTEKKINSALQTLGKMCRVNTRFLRGQIKNIFHHDWNRDPFSRGAYSYVGVGGLHAPKFYLPLDHKVFFAGEATVSGPARGTVHGALRSGVRAAKELKFANLTKWK